MPTSAAARESARPDWRPVINDASYAANVTNEGGYGGTYRFLKNVVGMWIAQQRRAMARRRNRSTATT